MNRVKKQVITTSSTEETQRIGAGLAKELLASQGLALRGKDKVLALYGELGSGKTTFVQGLARGLGIKKRIISPTFIIVRTYSVVIPNSFRDPNSKKMRKLVQHDINRTRNFVHIDLYRVDFPRDLKGLGIKEVLNNPQNIVAIEWAEKIKDLLPQERIDVRFRYIDSNKRGIVIDIKN